MEKEFALIELEETVIVSDPCYARTDDGVQIINNVKSGEYIPIVNYIEDTILGIRVRELILIHNNYKVSNFKLLSDSIYVDSGQAGIFSNSIYPEFETGEYGDLETFYGRCCENKNIDLNDLMIWDNVKTKISNTEECLIQSHWDTAFACLKVFSEDEYFQEYLDNTKRIIIQNNGNVEEVIDDMIATRDFNYNYYKKSFEYIDYYIKHKELPEKPFWNRCAEVDGKGFVSQSGFGDGCYNLYVKRNSKKEIVGLKLKFI